METIIEIFTHELGENFLNHLVFHYAIVFLLFLVTPALVAADLLYALSTAKKLGERIRSHKLRKSVEKILLYWGLQILAAIVGTIGLLFPYYNLPYLSILTTLVIVVIEGKSLVEHFRRRKDNLSKIPGAVQEILDFVGGEDEMAGIVRAVLKKKSGSDSAEKE